MEIGDTSGTATTALAGLIMLIGLAGVVVPFLPGLPLVWLGVLVWALPRQDALGWATLAVATVVVGGGMVVKYLVPGRRLRGAGVPVSTLLLGGVLGVIGFFVVPVVGSVLGFVLGIYLGERMRLPSGVPAGPATRAALAAVGWSVAIELTAGLLVVAAWAAALALGR